MDIVKKTERFLKNKKNRAYLFFFLGAIMLYFYIKNKQNQALQATSESSGYLSVYLKTDQTTGAGTGSNNGSTPVTNPFPTGTGNATPKLVNFSLPEHLKLSITGSSKNWVINDVSNVNLNGGYEFWYFMNGCQTIKQNTKLVNFNWNCNNPLTIQKICIKTGTDSLYPLGYGTDESLIQTYSYNNSVAFNTWIFNKL